MKLFIQILVLLTLLTPVYSQTQTDQQRIEGEISKPGFEPIPAMIPKPFVATPDAGPAAEELATVLGNDLYNSDYFEMIDASAYPPYTGQIKISDYKTSRAKYVALLKVSLEGSQVNVEARFYDVQSEQLVVGKVYKWDRKFVRHIAHRFGDEILYRLWGVKGIFTSKLAFSSDRSGNRDVWLMDYDGYNQTQVTKSKHINLSPDLSPDGKQVIYTTYRAEQAATGQMLIVYNIYDGKKSTLYSQGTLNSAPAWSSDGSRIAFTSNVKGNAEIYVINKDGSNL
ncbi:hypothetical protein L0244_40060, partial [bacterium]|nr:hypothetical protein [bacterium]